MPLDPKLRGIIEQAIDKKMEAAKDKAFLGSLKHFYSSRNHEFLYGFFAGWTFSESHVAAQAHLKRELDEEEYKEMLEVIERRTRQIDDTLAGS